MTREFTRMDGNTITLNTTTNEMMYVENNEEAGLLASFENIQQEIFDLKRISAPMETIEKRITFWNNEVERYKELINNKFNEFIRG